MYDKISLSSISLDQWKRIQEVFETIVGYPATERPARLHELCGNEAIVHSEVEKLLRVVDLPDPVDITIQAQQWWHVLEDAYSQYVRNKVGPYRLIKRIGAGGMGVVFLAERDDPDFSQCVALKLVRLDLPAGVTERFLQERRILAGLSHPNIARLLDGGISTDGMPYFAMEYVDGQPIDVYCDARRLSIDARLKLFLQVCEAVEHAHNNLVVHRDLKPSNILVTASGQVKLLDFGVAKLFENSANTCEKFRQTTTGFMTPIYASPEQIRREPTSTATDVYALGVILYELLTGDRPYRNAPESAGELERAICEEVLDKPSARWNIIDESRLARASARSSVYNRIARRLKGDLDVILLKALQKQPQRRYPSVDQFQSDVRRFLSNQPIMARPDTFSYKAQKFIQRHRWATLALLLFAITETGNHFRLAIERNRVEAALILANTERQRAEKVSQTMTAMFADANPNLGATDTLYAFRLLQNGKKHIDNLGNQPDVQITLLRTMGRAYCNLGYHRKAESLVKEAIAKSEAIFGRRSTAYAKSIADLAVIERVMGRRIQADSLFKIAWPILEASPEENHEAFIELLNGHVPILLSQDRLDESKQLLDRALAALSSYPATLEAHLPSIYENLGAYYHNKGDYPKAVAHQQKALEVLESLGKKTYPEYASVLMSLATTMETEGAIEKALQLKREALDIRRKVLPEDHLAIVTNLDQVAATLTKLHRHEEAIAYRTEMLHILEKHHQTDQRSIKATKTSLTANYEKRGSGLDVQK